MLIKINHFNITKKLSGSIFWYFTMLFSQLSFWVIVSKMYICCKARAAVKLMMPYFQLIYSVINLKWGFTLHWFASYYSTKNLSAGFSSYFLTDVLLIWLTADLDAYNLANVFFFISCCSLCVVQKRNTVCVSVGLREREDLNFFLHLFPLLLVQLYFIKFMQIWPKRSGCLRASLDWRRQSCGFIYSLGEKHA